MDVVRVVSTYIGVSASYTTTSCWILLLDSFTKCCEPMTNVLVKDTFNPVWKTCVSVVSVISSGFWGERKSRNFSSTQSF